jgi:MFS family permease
MADFEHDTADVPPRGWGAIAPALRFRNYRLFWLGLVVSTMGTYLQQVAEGWLIYDLTGSKLLPVVPISFLGGVIIDRVPRRKLITITQIGLLLQAALFSLLVITGQIRVWHIIFLDFALGALYAVDLPARQAFLLELVGKSDLANAIALNASTIQLARVVGCITAGVLIASIGPGGTMLLNAASYLAPIVALLLIRMQDTAQDTQRPPLKQALLEGITTLWDQSALVGALGLMTIVGGLASAVYVMMPAFTEDILAAGPVGLGLLLGAGGVGALLSTIAVSRLGQHNRGLTLTITSFLLPLTVIGFAVTRSLWAACLLLVAHGMVLLMLYTMANTLVQVNVPDRVRGRVMSIYALLNGGGSKSSGMVVGGLAEYLGLPLILSLSGVLSVLFALGLYVVMPAVRRLD